MSATATLPQAPTTTPKNVLLPCPLCGEPGASISLALNDLDGSCFHCGDCDNDFSIDDVRTFIAKWSRMLTWIENVPQFEE